MTLCKLDLLVLKIMITSYLLLGGIGKIDIVDWKSHTRLKHCNAETPVVKWFWDIMDSYSEEMRARLLQFVTGSSRVWKLIFKSLCAIIFKDVSKPGTPGINHQTKLASTNSNHEVPSWKEFESAFQMVLKRRLRKVKKKSSKNFNP